VSGVVSSLARRLLARLAAAAGLGLLALLLGAAFSDGVSRAVSTPLVADPVVLHSRVNDVSQPLRTLSATATPPLASTVRTTGGGTLLGPVESFEGIANQENLGGSKKRPPDAEGAVGPHDYVQWVNYSLAVYDKHGSREFGPVPGNVVWSGFGGPCQRLNVGDPVVRYDKQAGRWLLSQLGSAEDQSPPYAECFAVSTGPDPLGTYRYEFDIPDCSGFNDYVKVAVWPDAYYMTDNRYGDGVTPCSGKPLSTGPLGSGVFAFDRAAMLAGRPAAGVYFELGLPLLQIMPSDLDGTTTAPDGTPDVFVHADDGCHGAPKNQLELWTLSVSFSSPGSARFTRANDLTMTDTFDSGYCSSHPEIAQPDGGQALDRLGGYVLPRVSVRQLDGHQSLVAVQAEVSADGRTGLRWYEVLDPAQPGRATIHQQGDYFGPTGDTGDRWDGSAAQDGAGDIALGFSVVGPALPPSIGYAGLAAGGLAGKMMTGEGRLVTGGGAQTGFNRWGDYSSLTVDPVDDCTFWYTQEYYPVTAQYDWHTRIGSFRFAGCGPRPTISAGYQEGETLSASPGTWLTLPGASFGYQWRRCDATGGNCADITGATGAGYLVTTADVDGTLRVLVRASTGDAEASALSEQTPVIIPTPTAGPLQLSTSISASPTTVAANGLVSYTVQVGNGSRTGSATSLVLEVDLPTGAAFVSSSADRGPGCTFTGVVTCPLEFLPGGRTTMVTVNARLLVRGPQTAVASVTAEQAPVDPAAVRAAVTVNVQEAPKLAATAPLRTTWTATAVVVSGAVSLDEPAGLVVRAFGAHGQVLTLLARSKVGRSTLRQHASSIVTATAGGTVRLSLRVPPGRASGRVVVRATDRDGLTSTLLLRFRG